MNQNDFLQGIAKAADTASQQGIAEDLRMLDWLENMLPLLTETADQIVTTPEYREHLIEWVTIYGRVINSLLTSAVSAKRLTELFEKHPEHASPLTITPDVLPAHRAAVGQRLADLMQKITEFQP